jgi:hypothetical protein
MRNDPGDNPLAPQPMDGPASDEWAEERLRGADAMQQMLAEAGGALSASEVARLLGITPAAVHQRRAWSELLSVPLDGGEWGFPACQFAAAEVAPDLPRILAAAPGADPWVRLSILLSREPSLGDERLIDLVGRGHQIDDVARILRSYGVQGAC